jgi:hypothetical protein
MPIDEDVPADDTNAFPFSQYIETRRLSSARSSHECGQRSGFNIAIYVAKQLSRAVWDWNMIADTLPGKNTAVK